MSVKTPQLVEDFLDEDNEIPSQRYALLSFLSPERVLEKKELFFFEKFLQNYEIEWKSRNLEKFLADTVLSMNRELDENAVELEKKNMFDQAEICRKNRVSIETVMDNYHKFINQSRKELNSTRILESYRDFMFKNQNSLEEEYHAKNDFHTTMRGVKVRGVYSTYKEAEARGKKLQQKDKYFNIFVGEVGKWLPWDPEPHQVQDQEYAEEQLNTLMKKYKENEDGKERFFDERRKQDGKLGGQSQPKQIFGANTEANTTENSSEAAGGMFDLVGDLALQRRVQREADKNGDATGTPAVSNVVIQHATEEDVANAVPVNPSNVVENTVVENA
jgi:hypothetical protein